MHSCKMNSKEDSSKWCKVSTIKYQLIIIKMEETILIMDNKETISTMDNNKDNKEVISTVGTKEEETFKE